MEKRSRKKSQDKASFPADQPPLPEAPATEQPQEATVPEQAAQAIADGATAAQQTEEQLRAEALKTLKLAGKSYRGAEKSYRDGLLLCGQHCSAYVNQRLALGDTREASTDTLRLELQQYASSKVDVNDLMASRAAYDLFCASQGMEDTVDVPYGHYRDCWRPLVQRVTVKKSATVKASEHWIILPGIEAAALELFKTCVKDSLSKSATEEKTKELQRLFTTLEAKAKKDAQEAQAQKLRDEKAAQEAADKVVREAQIEAERALQASKVALDSLKEDEKAALTQKMEDSKAALLKAQQDKAAQDARVEAERKEKDRADAAAKAAQEREEKAQLAEQKRLKDEADRAAGIPRTKPEPRSPKSLLPEGTAAARTAMVATAKDWAESLAGALFEHQEPMEVLAELLRLAKNDKRTTPAMVKALSAGSLVYNREIAPAQRPVTGAPLHETNGAMVGAA